jgi:hypothetical protein
MYPEIFIDYRHLIRLLERWGEDPSTVNHLTFGFQSFAVRTTGEPRDMIPVVRQTVRSVDVNAGIDAIQPLEQLVAQSVARQRFYAVMLGLFAIVARCSPRSASTACWPTRWCSAGRKSACGWRWVRSAVRC